MDVDHVGRRSALENALNAKGLTSEDIDITILSHAHWDHSQNYDLFPRAPIPVHPLEWKYAHKPYRNDCATPAWSGAIIEFRPKIGEVEEGHVIEPGVILMHTPGHSPGSISVVVETPQGLCAVKGEVLHYSTVALTRKNPLVFLNEMNATQSIDRIVEQADIIYPCQYRAFHVVNRKIEYLAEEKMAVA